MRTDQASAEEPVGEDDAPQPQERPIGSTQSGNQYADPTTNPELYDGVSVYANAYSAIPNVGILNESRGARSARGTNSTDFRGIIQ